MSVQQVTEVLRSMDNLYSILVSLSQEKQQAIMDNDVVQLTKVMTEESRVLKHAAGLETAREQEVALFLQEKGIRSQLSLTITEMTRLVFDPEEKEMLLEAQRQLSNTLHELKRLNALNKELVEQSLNFIDYSLNLLTSLPEEEVVYSDPSKQQSSQKIRSFFDTRA